MMTAGAPAGVIIALALQAATPAAHVDRSAAKWGVEYAPNQCIINRAFGDGPKPEILAIDVDPVYGGGDLVLLTATPVSRGKSGVATITLAPTGPSLRASWIAAPTQQGGYALRLLLEPEKWQQIRTAKQLSIDAGAIFPVSVPVEGIDKAFAAAKACGRDLLKSWGADPDAMIDTGGQLNRDWIQVADYPADAFRSGQQGIVRILVTVDANGRPTACKVARSSGVPSLDTATCTAMMTRGRFSPSDRKVRYFYQKTSWINPN